MNLSELLLDTPCERARQDVTQHLPHAWQTALGDKKVYVRDMSGTQRAAWGKEDVKDEVLLIIFTLVGEDNQPLFTLKQRHELERKLPGSSIVQLAYKANEVCGFFWTPPVSPSRNGHVTEPCLESVNA